MLSKKYIAKRYAAALLGAAEDGGVMQPVFDDLLTLKGMISRDAAQKRLLFGVATPSKVKHELLRSVVQHQSINKVVVSFLDLLVRHKRVGFFDEICSYYKKLMLERKGESILVVESAEPLDDLTYQDISSVLRKALKRPIIIETIINKQLLGGLVFKLDNKMLDCSLRNKLRKIEKALLSTPVNRLTP